MVGICIFPSKKLSWINSSIPITLDGFTLKYYSSDRFSQFNNESKNYYYLVLG